MEIAIIQRENGITEELEIIKKTRLIFYLKNGERYGRRKYSLIGKKKSIFPFLKAISYKKGPFQF